MLKKKLLIFLVIQTFLIFGCKDANQKANLENEACVQGKLLSANNLPSTVTTFVMNDAFKDIPQRQDDFNESLEIVVSVQDLGNLNSESLEKITNLSINLYYKNTSSTDLIMRLPKAIGFSNRSVATIDDGYYDLEFELYTANKKPVAIHSKRGEFIDENVNLSDFVVIKPNENSCSNYKLETTQVYIDGVEYDFLPHGDYLLYAEYQNYLIGNILPLIETPPPNLDESEKIDWELNHKNLVDLNAWVGIVESEIIKFTAP